jgi:hypothetical protein
MAPKPLVSTPSPLGTGTARSADQPSQTVHNAIALLENRIAFGKASRELATICLALLARGVESHPTVSIAERMRRSQAGTRVLRWLWSSNNFHAHKVIFHRTFVRELVPFLVAEGRTEVIWNWIQAANVSEDKCPIDVAKAKGFLLRQFVEAEMVYGDGLNKALDHHARAMSLRPDRPDSLGKASSEPSLADFSAREVKSLVRPASYYLTFHCIQPSATVTDARLRRFCRTARSWTRWYPYACARLLLCSPASKDPSAALLLLEAASRVPAGSLVPYKDPQQARRALANLGLATAERRLEQGFISDATRLMRFLQKSFPEELGLRIESSEPTYLSSSLLSPQRQASPASTRTLDDANEQTSLRLLEGLRLT